MEEQQRHDDEMARARTERESGTALQKLVERTTRCHLSNSHLSGMGGCAARCVNHRVDYSNLGGFTERCPWGCEGRYMKSEWDRLAKPPRGTSGLKTKCCKNGRTNTPYMQNINHIPPPLLLSSRSTKFINFAIEQ